MSASHSWFDYAAFAEDAQVSQDYGRPTHIARAPDRNGLMHKGKSQSWFYFFSKPHHEKEDGWKVHLSVQATQIPAAWNILVPLLMQHGIYHAKVTSPLGIKNHSDPLAGEQYGKFLVIFDKHSVVPWQALLQDIEMAFVQAGIASGIPLQIDRRVKGSRYAYYRNAHDQNGDYISSDMSHSYNMSGKPDPFDAITIDVTDITPPVFQRQSDIPIFLRQSEQPEIPVFKRASPSGKTLQS